MLLGFAGKKTGVEGTEEATIKDTEEVAKKLTRKALRLFDEPVDYALEAGVPDPVPFEGKLEGMLAEHGELIFTDEERALGTTVLAEVRH